MVFEWKKNKKIGQNKRMCEVEVELERNWGIIWIDGTGMTSNSF